MKALLTLGLLLLSLTVQAKVFEHCEFARILKSHGMDGYGGHSLANWVCLAQHESHLNTRLTKNHGNKYTMYGIFQISSEFWCDDGKIPKPENGCGIPCSALLKDDVTQAIECAKKIMKAPQGIRAWAAWITHCENKDVSKYTQNCGL